MDPNAVPAGAAPNYLAAYGQMLQELWLPILLLALWAYFCGCFNGAVIVSKYILRDDVRTHGSGNAGLTNFYRTFGGPLTLVVILCDVLRQWWPFDRRFCGQVSRRPRRSAPSGQILGRPVLPAGPHVPLYVPLQGGQGHPVRRHHRHHDRLAGGPGGVGGFLILAILTKYVSLGSIWAGASFPVATFFVYRDPVLTLLGLLLGGLVVFMHRGNIKRLLTGTENKFSLHHKKE